MSEIKIETLSPIHIGNGTFLQKGNDYIVEEDYINVLSLDKLGKIIGTDNTTGCFSGIFITLLCKNWICV